MRFQGEVAGELYDRGERLRTVLGSHEADELGSPGMGAAISGWERPLPWEAPAIPVAVWGEPSSKNRVVVIGSRTQEDLATDAQFAGALLGALGSDADDSAVFLIDASTLSTSGRPNQNYPDSVAAIMVDKTADRVFLLPGRNANDFEAYARAAEQGAGLESIRLHILAGGTPESVAQAVQVVLAPPPRRRAVRPRLRTGTPGAPGGIPWDTSGSGNPSSGHTLGPSGP